jgi:hypothetical protein
MKRFLFQAGNFRNSLYRKRNKPAALTPACIMLLFCSMWLQNLRSQSYIPEKNTALLKVKPAIPIKAYRFNLQDVILLPGSPFYRARQLDSAYLMLLKPDRMLYRFHRHAGLAPKDSVYGGWESEGLSGHTLGHYLSAASLMYATTGNQTFKNRVIYTVSELARCQQARKSGYVGAIPNEDSIFARVARGEIKSSGFDLNGGWSPWYTVHKVMAGLVDAYLYTGNKQALEVVMKMADWTWNTVHGLPDSTRLKMLNCEYGGMNDVLANIYAITGNRRYLTCSYLFYDEFVMGKLAKRIDPLPGKHSNTNVPKAIGAARQYELTALEPDKTIASFFWETMVNHHTYVIGGNSNYEYCGDPDKLNDRLSDNTCETCNTYNMLKLTMHLFSWQPDARLGDFYERALYNHILASQNPETGMMCYFVPLRMGTSKSFSDSFQTFTCCVGSGLENHSKYNEGIYYEGADGSLLVNLFIPSRLTWKTKKISITQLTRFPEESNIRFEIRARQPTTFDLRIRKPAWAMDKVLVQVNNTTIPAETDASGYIHINRNWADKDQVEINFPMELYTEAMPDNPERIAFLYGPVVLAGKLGKTMPDPVFGTPVIMTANRDIRNWTLPIAGKPLHFRWSNAGQPRDVELSPFYQVYDEYYSVYWDFFTPEQWSLRQADYEAEKKRLSEIAARTIDEFRIGEMQPERDHQLKATERSYVSDAIGRMGREARTGHHFSFVMKVEPGIENTLLLTYIGDDKDRIFDILVDGEKLTTVEWKGGQTGRFYDIPYALPTSVTGSKNSITVTVEANKGKTAGRVFGVRTLRGS